MTMTETWVAILLNSMGTSIGALNLHPVMAVQITQCISILITKKRMEQEGEVEGEERGIEM